MRIFAGVPWEGHQLLNDCNDVHLVIYGQYVSPTATPTEY